MMKPTSTIKHPGFFLLILLGLALVASAAMARPKTDVFVLSNGDDVTCEIKEMFYGKLQAKTDDMGTVSVKWDKVVRLSSDYRYLVKHKSGTLHFGSLPDSGTDGVLAVVTQTGTIQLVMAEVASIEAIRIKFWDRVNISLSAGFNWTKASETSQANLMGNFGYKGRMYRWGLDSNGAVTSERDNRTTRRYDVTLYGSRLLSGRLQARLGGGLSRNDQLGLNLRTSTNLTLGYRLLMDRHLDLLVSGGVSGNREWDRGDDPPSNSMEGIFSVLFALFRYDTPKVDLSFTADLFPSLTVKERVRFELGLALRKELLKDLFLELTYYLSLDNRPPSGAEGTSDQGIIFGLGWSK